MTASASASKLNLRAGEWVQVRTAEEILSTLDATQALDGLPFMPEMLQYCGKRFRVFKSAHKTCDTVRDYNIRRMTRAVHLEGLRCDGQGHAGCQAGCLIFWKEAWLKRVDAAGTATNEPEISAEIRTRQWDIVMHGARIPRRDSEPERFRCQATDLLMFTGEVRRRDRWDPRWYLKDLTSGNVSIVDFVRYGLFAMFNAFMARWFNRRYPHLCGVAPKPTPTAILNLQAGEQVQVRSRDEIMQTVGPNMKNRGLHFDVEMVPFCGETHTVRTRVERIVDEKTGLLITMPNPCLILEGVSCGGMLSSSRMFCPRSTYPYWREIWVKRQGDSASETTESRH